MTDRENNTKMQLTIDTKVVGSKVAGFSINGRSVVIAFDSGYTASFDVVGNFDLIGPGKWVFMPNVSPGRPKKAALQSPANHGEQPKGTQGENE